MYLMWTMAIYTNEVILFWTKVVDILTERQKNMLYCLSTLKYTNIAGRCKTVPHTHILQSSPPLLGYWTGTLDIHKTHAPWCGWNDN